MGDNGQVDLEDSNMANYGGKDHRNAMKAAAESEKEFVGAGKKVGVEVWRVENRRTESDTPDFGVKRWPKEQYGEFYDGDSYIVLNTYNVIDPETKKKTDALAWDVHFWLGKDTSIDERGVAAYKTVELDDLLDDGPVQHRETMNNESNLFQSYFKNGMQYLAGGIESGFRKVKPEEYKPRLLQIRKTKGTIKQLEVPCKCSSMNHGDCFILDIGLDIIAWYGKEASPFEKSACGRALHSFVQGRMGKSKGAEINKGNEKMFWDNLEGTEADIKSAEAADKLPEPSLDRDAVKLFRISDASGSVQFTEEKPSDPKGFTWDQLDTMDVFVVDSGHEIFIWVGSKATKKEATSAWSRVDEYIAKYERPPTLPVTVIQEGKVNSVLRASFID